LIEVYNEQDERDAKDNDSNFSDESFQRKKREESNLLRKKTRRIEDSTNDDEDELYVTNKKSALRGDSAIGAGNHLEESKSVTVNPSKMSVAP